MVRANSPHERPAVFTTIPARGSRTMRLRYVSVKPIVKLKPGTGRWRLRAIPRVSSNCSDPSFRCRSELRFAADAPHAYSSRAHSSHAHVPRAHFPRAHSSHAFPPRSHLQRPTIMALAPRLVDLVEQAAVGEVDLVGRLPVVGDLRQSEQLDLREPSSVFRRCLLGAGPVVMLRGDLLPLVC